MSIDRRLLDILCCPVSKRALKSMSREQLRRINDEIAAGRVRDVENRTVATALQDGLITDDGKVLYRIEDDIPVSLPEDGIGTTQFEGFPD